MSSGPCLHLRYCVESPVNLVRLLFQEMQSYTKLVQRVRFRDLRLRNKKTHKDQNTKWENFSRFSQRWNVFYDFRAAHFMANCTANFFGDAIENHKKTMLK